MQSQSNIYHSTNNADAAAKAGKPGPVVTRNQKLAVVFLFAFVFVIVGLNIYSIKQTLRNSIAYQGEQKRIPGEEEAASSTDSIAQQTDTDGDGLFDYDERNIYNTSAYLHDTDGDNLSDGDEVRKGTDPLCVEGKDCANRGALYSQTATVDASTTPVAAEKQVFTSEQLAQMQQLAQLAELNSQASATAAIVPGSAVAGADANTQAERIISGKADVGTLRQALLASGMDKAQLDQISDDMLMNNYNNLLKRQAK